MRFDVCMLGMVYKYGIGKGRKVQQGQQVDINSDDYFNLYLCTAWLATIYNIC